MTVDLSGPLERAARHVHESLCQKVAERGFEVTRWEDLTDYAQGLRVAEVRPLVEAAFDGVPDLDALSDKVFDLEGQRDRARALAAALMDEDRRRGFDTTGPLVTHDRDDCQGRGCPIHHPSDHHMRGWPRNWRSDRGLMERMCEHIVWHPDPDDAEFRATRGDTDTLHGCCVGTCCVPD